MGAKDAEAMEHVKFTPSRMEEGYFDWVYTEMNDRQRQRQRQKKATKTRLLSVKPICNL